MTGTIDLLGIIGVAFVLTMCVLSVIFLRRSSMTGDGRSGRYASLVEFTDLGRNTTTVLKSIPLETHLLSSSGDLEQLGSEQLRQFEPNPLEAAFDVQPVQPMNLVTSMPLTVNRAARRAQMLGAQNNI